TVDEKGHAEKRLAALRRAAQKRRPAGRQTSERQIVQTADTCRGFGKMYRCPRDRGRRITIWHPTNLLKRCGRFCGPRIIALERDLGRTKPSAPEVRSQ